MVPIARSAARIGQEGGMATIKPVNDDHSVVSVVFILHLSSPIEAAVIASLIAKRARLPWSEALPAMGQGVVQVLQEDGSTSTIPTLRFSVVRPNGTATWQLHFNGTQLEVGCQLYTRWVGVSGTAKSYLTAAFELLREQISELKITQLQLLVSDSFKAEEGPYEVNEFLQSGGLLGTTPFEHGMLWHVNTGWFEKNDAGRTLHNMAVNSVGTSPEAPGGEEDIGPPYTVSLVHAMQHQPKELLTSVDTSFEVFGHMHQRNKALLLKILSKSVLDRIGLQA